MDELKGPLKQLVDEKAEVIRSWAKAGKIAKCDPYHLIFAIWSTTQHYADFDVQVRAVLGQENAGEGRFEDAAAFSSGCSSTGCRCGSSLSGCGQGSGELRAVTDDPGFKRCPCGPARLISSRLWPSKLNPRARQFGRTASSTSCSFAGLPVGSRVESVYADDRERGCLAVAHFADDRRPRVEAEWRASALLSSPSKVWLSARIPCDNRGGGRQCLRQASRQGLHPKIASARRR